MVTLDDGRFLVYVYSVITPVWKSFIEPELTQLYNNLKALDYIDTQTYNTHLKSYGSNPGIMNVSTTI